MAPSLPTLVGLLGPAAVAVLLACFVPPRQSGWLTPIVGLAALAAHHLGGDFALSPRWPGSLPDGLALLLGAAVLLMMPALGRETRSWTAFSWTGGVTALLVLASFPWWLRGAGGWWMYVGMTLGVFALHHGVMRVAPKGRFALVGYALVLFIAAALLLLGTASGTHLIALVSVVAPAGLVGVVAAARNLQWFGAVGLAWITLAGALLVGNAAIRFVPDPESVWPEKNLIVAAAAVFALVPLTATWIPRRLVRWRAGWALMGMLAGAALAMAVYLHESGSGGKGDGAGYDYSSTGE